MTRMQTFWNEKTFDQKKSIKMFKLRTITVFILEIMRWIKNFFLKNQNNPIPWSALGLIADDFLFFSNFHG